MSARFPDTFLMQREVLALRSVESKWFLVACYFHARINGTRGLIRKEDLALVCSDVEDPEAAVAALTESGALHDSQADCGSPHCLRVSRRAGWIVHDYLRENPADEQVPRPSQSPSATARPGTPPAASAPIRERKGQGRRSEAALEVNHRRWHTGRGIRKDGCPLCLADPPGSYPQPGRPQAPREAPDRPGDRSRLTLQPIQEPTGQPTDRPMTDPVNNLSQNHQSPGHSPADRPGTDQSDGTGTDTPTDQPADQSPGIRPSAISPAPAGTDSVSLTAAVAEAISRRAGQSVTQDEALRAITTIQQRAAFSGQTIHAPSRYILAAIEAESDVYALLQAGGGLLPGTLTSVRSGEDPPADGEDPRHGFEFDPATGSCRVCDYPRGNTRQHRPEKAGAAAS